MLKLEEFDEQYWGSLGDTIRPTIGGTEEDLKNGMASDNRMIKQIVRKSEPMGPTLIHR